MTAQTMQEKYDAFRKSVISEYSSFREECNKKYIDFLKEKWNQFEQNTPLSLPEDKKPIPPAPYVQQDSKPIATTPIEIEPIKSTPQPLPIEPIREQPVESDFFLTFNLYDVNCKVRLPDHFDINLTDCNPTSIAQAWNKMSSDGMNNTIRDCLEMRLLHDLCDWAYLKYLDNLGKAYFEDTNKATLLTAFLYCQSGYQMRLGEDCNKLVLLYGTRHFIYGIPYYSVNGTYYYPLEESSKNLNICDAAFEGEKPMSLIIDKEPIFGEQMSEVRKISSKSDSLICVNSQVPKSLIDFYNGYPTSALGGNPMTRWAMYANTPLSLKTSELLYPKLREELNGMTQCEAAGKLLNLVQTGFKYEYDDKVWGYDRAFFAEESLYYPYCDCEDRSILFSRLVRDLLNLDVALIYYPGHLATAVCFNEEVDGASMKINDKKFIVCDPTYIGAPIGTQMPGLDCSDVRAIVLNK
ncbi:MAG: hypothetical protein K2L93_01810 [Muribaculaceae bacterium]|nr:hypothetical protein [Muribaculaceae bacterium]MDE6321012.1 hypothetical protein [Muribaculaceae bacterium]